MKEMECTVMNNEHKFLLLSHRYELKRGEGGIKYLLAEFQFEKMKRIPINR